MTTLRQSLNKGCGNSVDAALQLLGAGEAFALVPRTVRAAVVSNVLTLPETARCALLLSAYAMGTTPGWKLPTAPGTAAAPTTTNAGVDASGNIIFPAADAITAAVVRYLAFEGDVFEDTIDVATNAGTLLGGRRAQLILSATRLVGGAIGASTPVYRPATPTAGQVAILSTDDAQVAFPAADAVTRATIRYLAIPGVGATARGTVGDALAATAYMV